LQDGGVEPRAVRPGRSWPFAAALVLFVVVLGLLPHVRFSLLVGEPTCFFSARQTVCLAFGGGPAFASVAVVAALRLLSKLCGGSWNLALVLADVIFPGACAVLAWILVGHLTRRRLLRLLLALVLLFAQEFFSLGCWTIWQSGDVLGVATPDSSVYDLRFCARSGPAGLAVARLHQPVSHPCSDTGLRTSRVVLFALLAALLATCRARPASGRRVRSVTLGLLLNAGLAGTHFSQAAAIVVFEGLLSLALLACRRSKLARIFGTFAAVGAASLLVGALAYWSAASYGKAFASRLPVVTPSVVGAVAGLLLLGTVLRRSRGRDLYPVAAACFGTVLVLTNQQVLTGRMVLISTWERNVDYPLVFLGAAIVWRGCCSGARVGLPALYAVAGAALFLVSSVLPGPRTACFSRSTSLRTSRAWPCGGPWRRWRHRACAGRHGCSRIRPGR
jgi:hypothetical protein